MFLKKKHDKKNTATVTPSNVITPSSVITDGFNFDDINSSLCFFNIVIPQICRYFLLF